jgi:DNA-directed RNA polymerase specialized sigma24 family protein
VSRAPAPDVAETVASIAVEKRAILLRTYRGWLRTEDLEDCYSQATLELLVRARRGCAFQSAGHIANALEQKLCSRIRDRRRALAGRSALEAALAGALPLGDPDGGGVELADPRAGIEEVVATRLRLRHLLAAARALSHDQRLQLACQLELDLSAGQFCDRFGWSMEKYRKVAQRGRARLRLLVERDSNSDFEGNSRACVLAASQVVPALASRRKETETHL